jgi:dTDP-glucose 4,6-dehydratase
MTTTRRRYLVTGGAGFIGSNFIRHLLETEPTAEIVNLDAMTYAAVPQTLDDLATHPNHRFIHGDIRDRSLVSKYMQGVDVVVHFAAESHVDRSIDSPAEFIETNVAGTDILLSEARDRDVGLFIHVSTDEVYGSMTSGRATEDAALNPSSPYSASKAGSDLLVLSYGHTYDMAVIVTRCTNNYGPFQFPEKLIPRFTTLLLDGDRVPLYGDGLHERDWIHVSDHCAALSAVIDHGSRGEVYNIGADAQWTNIDVVRAILDVLQLGEERIEYVADRPGHDRRYAVDSTKVRELGWLPQRRFEDRIAETVQWYRDNTAWWRSALGGVT